MGSLAGNHKPTLRVLHGADKIVFGFKDIYLRARPFLVSGVATIGVAALLAGNSGWVAAGTAGPPGHVYLPLVSASGSAGHTLPSPTPPLQPGVVDQPIVFVSRQRPAPGSKFDPQTNVLPGIGAYSRFEVAAPGKLEILHPDGTLTTLVDGSHPTATSLNLIDVNAPAVSYDAKTILFAGLPDGTYPTGPDQEPGGWRIYAIKVDGTGLRQLTFSDQHLDLSQFGSMAQALRAYDDTDPAWLPDGRIVFSSTRWPETAEYEGVRASNLYVVNADGTSLHRITSERNGADRPLVDPLTGKIVFARWWRNNHYAVDSSATIYANGLDASQGYIQDNGLTIIPSAAIGPYQALDTNFWQADSINPDGTRLQAWRMNFRDPTDNQYYGGAFTPAGQLVGNYFPTDNLAESGGFGGLRLLTRGFFPSRPLIGVTTDDQPHLVCTGCFGVFSGPYAAEPDVLPDGRIVFSWAPDVRQDYGLYLMNPDGTGRTLLYDNPGTSETRPRVIVPRPVPPIIPDSLSTVAPLLPPPANDPYTSGGTFTFQDLNVYANGPVDAPIVNAPPVGSASAIRFFIDQQRTANASVSQYDWPILLATATVSPDGSVTNSQAPADVPLFEQIRDAGGNVPLTTDVPNLTESGAAHVAGMNYGRPGQVQQCVGCHAGHSLLPVPADPRWTNLATGARVSVSSTADPSTNQGLNDRRVMTGSFLDYWRSAPGQATGQWVELTFPVPVTVRTVRLYNPRVDQDVYGNQCNVQVLGATVRLYADTGATSELANQTVGTLTTAGVDATFADVPNVRVVRVEIGATTGTFNGEPAASLAEIEVIAHG